MKGKEDSLMESCSEKFLVSMYAKLCYSESGHNYVITSDNCWEGRNKLDARSQQLY